MTRPSLFHRSETHRRQRDPRELSRPRRHRAPRLSSRSSPAPAVAIEVEPTDGEAGRVRAAGGPLDLASYTCGCGFVFNAAVSTTVACPHCGCEQAW